MNAAVDALARFLAGLQRGRRLRLSRTRRVALCSIATENFLPWTLALFDALARHHPGSTRVLLYVRAPGEARRLPVIEGTHVIGLEALVDAPVEDELRRRFGMAELCFAMKPRLLGHCLDRFGDRALYLDSDLDVHSPLQEAMLALESASVVLTPHIDTPVPADGKLPSEVTIARAGAFNAGFVGVGEGEETRAFLAWWGNRVARWGFVAPHYGYQGDQKWLDLAPSLFPGVALLRDPASNVGAWNLHGRRLARGETGFTVNGIPLGFFHFSGFDPDRPGILSRYQDRIRFEHEPALAELAADYARRVIEARPRAAALAWQALPEPARVAPAATALEEPMAPGDYRASIDFGAPTGAFATYEKVELAVRVTNTSGRKLQVAPGPDGRGGIALSYHLCDGDGRVLRWDNDRFALPRDLEPGESLEMPIGFHAPAFPASYRIELDLLHEGVAWFSAQGNPTAPFLIYVETFDERP